MKNKIKNRIMMISFVVMIITNLILSSCGNTPEAGETEKKAPVHKTQEQLQADARLQWFRDARFGMFIHWGLYSNPAGVWKGKPTTFFGEWIMQRARIPVKEYELLAKDFNPVKFNADEWVQIAKDAGMKYIVITAKHHDGFAMYHSTSSKYNIIDATPFGRDPMKELATACEKFGIKLCFYYSHDDDWHEPNADGNNWDFHGKRDFSIFFEGKVKPQVKELLTNYGPIYCMWFDNPSMINREQAQELVDLVHGLQPNCLVNGRVGFGLGDYAIPTDNQVETDNPEQIWEATVTMNDTYGYRKDDNNWKSVSTLICQLVRCASRNGNYLLNVGPTGEGLIPQPSIDRLRAVGKWMKVNGESIYSTKGSPFPYNLEWSMITTRPGKIYVHVFNWPGEILEIHGIKSRVKRAYLLADPSTSLKIKQKSDKKHNLYSVILNVPSEAPDENDSVVVLEFDPDSEIEVFKGLIQQPDGTTTLDPLLAILNKIASKSSLRIDNRGYAINWTNAEDSINWDFSMFSKGEYELQVITAPANRMINFQEGRKILVDLNGKKVEFALNNDGKWVDESNPVQPYFISKLGRIKIDRKGIQNLVLQLINGQPSVPSQTAQNPAGGGGLQQRVPSGTVLVKVILVPVK
jgi:alpha-L-fucosidase